jgi:hypothetical protein
MAEKALADAVVEGKHNKSARETGGATLTAAQAIAIFVAKARRTPRDITSAKLAAEHGVTMKAVRDIWNLRTWVHTTMPYWSHGDLHVQRFLSKHLCTTCRRNGVQNIASACRACAGPRRRGRRPQNQQDYQIMNLETQAPGPVCAPNALFHLDHLYNHGNPRIPHGGGENGRLLHRQVPYPAQHGHPDAMTTWEMDAHEAYEANTADLQTLHDDQNLNTVVHDSTWLLYQQVFAKLGCDFDGSCHNGVGVVLNSSSQSSTVTSTEPSSSPLDIVMAASGGRAAPCIPSTCARDDKGHWDTSASHCGVHLDNFGVYSECTERFSVDRSNFGRHPPVAEM